MSYIVKIFLLLVFSLLPINSFSSGLMITPSRVEFSGTIKNAEVNVINSSDKESKYRVSLVHLSMDENGTYKKITENETPSLDEKFADNLIIYSPKQISLKPGETQTVRIMVKKPKDLEQGQYRSHLMIKEENTENLENDIEKIKDKNIDDKKISIVLKPLFAVTIPLIVNHGDLTGEISISNLTLQKSTNKNNKDTLMVDIDRSGNSGVYGDILVTFIPNKSSNRYEIGKMNNVAVFYPYPKRKVPVLLELKDDLKLKDGTIEVSIFRKKFDDQTKSDKKSLLARSSIKID